MLEQAGAGILRQLDYHFALKPIDWLVNPFTGREINTYQSDGHVRKAFVGLADVRQAGLVEQYLLDDESGHGLAQLRAAVHDA